MAYIQENTLIMLILALLLPPVAVLLKVGVTKHLWISFALVVLTLGIGSILHAFYIVLTK